MATRSGSTCATRLLLLLLLTLPAVLQAQFTYTTNADNTITITGYTGPGGAVTIPSTINGLPVTSIGDQVFDEYPNLSGSPLTSVTIPDSVTSLGTYSFYHCWALTNVTIPNSVTDIGERAFGQCSSLASLTIPNSVTNLGDSAFEECSSLTSVTIPNSVTRIPMALFWGCTGLTNVTVGNRVTSIGDEAFLACISLLGVYFLGDAPSLDGSSVFDWDINATVYYLPGTMGWGSTFGGLPTALWQPLAPAIWTLSAGTITATGATLNGRVNPNGSLTAAWFQWGTTTNYGNATAATGMGSGTNVLPLSAPLAGLVPGVTYHYRVAATNSHGAVYSSDGSFTTLGPPEVWTLAATAVTAANAMVNGTVNPNGYSTTAWFQWGNATSYGNLTAATDLGSGTSDLPLSAALAGLTLGATYHFRVAATNSYGVVYGMDQSFTAVTPGGTVISWGHQRMPLIPSDTRFQSVAAGYYHNLALKQDGTVVAWGEDDSSGACAVPGGLSGVMSVAAGFGHSLALKEDGTVVAWGANYNGQATVPDHLSGVIAIAAGDGHSLALKQDGTAVAWGVLANGSGPSSASVPRDLSGVTAIAAGGEHCLALKQDGTVVAWGSNSYGETNVPPRLSGSRVVGIAAGFGHSLALKQDGTVVAWGWDQYGQTDVPSGLNNVIAIAASYGHSLALKDDGTVVAWGAGRTVNSWTQDHGESMVPSGLGGVIGIGAGGAHSLALKQDGTLVAWGRDDYAQATVPGSLSGVVAVASAWNHNLALKQDGTVVSWGDEYSTATNVPAGLGGVIAVAAGEGHSLALKGDGTVVAWGDNQDGQATLPSELTGSKVIGIAAGQLHSLALKEDGTVVAWGLTAEGISTVPRDLSGVVAVAAAYQHSLALKADGTVVAWGSNYRGETNVPSGLNGVIAIAAGYDHSLALKRDETVVAWGSNADGQTAVPSGLNGVIAIAAGAYHSMALKQDGTVVAWGYNSDGTTDVPNGLNFVGGIAGGKDHSLALVLDDPVLTKPPQTQTAEVGSTICLYVSAVGFSPLEYQWFFNGTDILGVPTTNAFLRLTNVQPAQAGAYTVVATNAVATVGSAPAMLSVIPSVERRWVPGLALTGQLGSTLNLDGADVMPPAPDWAALASIFLTNDSQWYFDLSTPLPPQRFYRAWQTGTPGMRPSLGLHMVPAITLTGSIGHSVRVDAINQFGPIDAWFTLDTVTLTNTPQLYFDTSSIGQPARLWRIVPVP
jgi:alpha-tubulin suppressor-like RCC1 family protein